LCLLKKVLINSSFCLHSWRWPLWHIFNKSLCAMQAVLCYTLEIQFYLLTNSLRVMRVSVPLAPWNKLTKSLRVMRVSVPLAPWNIILFCSQTHYVPWGWMFHYTLEIFYFAHKPRNISMGNWLNLQTLYLLPLQCICSKTNE
jgi:hypothetical protein